MAASASTSGWRSRTFGGLRFYERMEVKDLLAYFNLMMNPLDNVAFERVCNAPRRGVGDTSIERLRNEAKAKGLSEYNYLLTFHDSDVETELPKKAQTALLAMIKKIEETKLRENLEAYSAVLRDFAKDIGYYDYIAGEEDLDEDRIGNVNALFDDINHYLSTHPESDFTEYLQNVSLLTSQDDMKGGNYVSFMTVHVAKGLEFDNVFVICLNEMVFPSGRSLMEDTSGDTIEEERRLAYVAFTRARKRLFLSCNKSYSYQTDSHQEPSRFFKEAGIVLPGNSYWSTDSWKTPFKKPGYERSTFSFKKKPHDEFGDGEAIDPFKKSQQGPRRQHHRRRFREGRDEDHPRHPPVGQSHFQRRGGMSIWPTTKQSRSGWRNSPPSSRNTTGSTTSRTPRRSRMPISTPS